MQECISAFFSAFFLRGTSRRNVETDRFFSNCSHAGLTLAFADSVKSCLWPVLTVSDRSRRGKRKKKQACVLGGVFSSLTPAGLSSHNPLGRLLNGGRLQTEPVQVFPLPPCRRWLSAPFFFTLRLLFVSRRETKFDLAWLTPSWSAFTLVY